MLCATTDLFIMHADDHFPNDDFFPGIDNLFDYMGERQRQSQCHCRYVFVFFLFDILLEFLFLLLP